MRFEILQLQDQVAGDAKLSIVLALDLEMDPCGLQESYRTGSTVLARVVGRLNED